MMTKRAFAFLAVLAAMVGGALPSRAGNRHIAVFYGDERNGMMSVGYGDTMREAADEAKKGCTTAGCKGVLTCNGGLQPGMGAIMAVDSKEVGATVIGGNCGFANETAARNGMTEICRRHTKGKGNCGKVLIGDALR